MVTDGLHKVVHQLIPKTSKPEPSILINLGCENWEPKPGFGDCEDFNPAEKLYTNYNVDMFTGRPVSNLIIHNLNHEPWPFETRYADVMLAIDVIEHLENPWLFLRECKRILKPGGVLILTTPNILSPITMTLWPYFNWFGPLEWDKSEHVNPMPVYEFRCISNNLQFPIVKEFYHPPEGMILIGFVFRKLEDEEVKL